MKILFIHNKYGKSSGEEIMLQRIIDLLDAEGHQVYTFFKSSEGLKKSFFKKISAFFSGIYSINSKKEVEKIINTIKPDIVQIQNLFPLISPSILSTIHKYNIPVIMRLSNYRLVCPNGLFMRNGEVCEACAGGREYYCCFYNCEGNILKSLGYAARTAFSRKLKLYHKYVNYYYAQTQFQKNKLIEFGMPATKIYVIPNMVYVDECPQPPPSSIYTKTNFIGMAGRISKEKGVNVLVSTARMNKSIRYELAGNFQSDDDTLKSLPSNVILKGQLNPIELDSFYRQSTLIVVCSNCYEGFPSVIVEAMLRGKAVICSRIGGLPEIVDDGTTGLLFTPGNSTDLYLKIQTLLNDPQLHKQMGINSRKKVLKHYTSKQYYHKLINLYNKALE